MRMRRDILALTVMAGLLAGCDFDELSSFGNAHAYEKDFHQHYPLKSGGRLSLENFNGAVEISGWDQDRVQIDGVQYASTEQLRDAISIDVVATGDTIHIRTVRPVSPRGNMGVKYVIKTPRKVQLDRIVTTNGSIRVDDLEGVARLRTSNGAVRIARTRGEVEAQTTNGPVEVSNLNGAATIRTTNGGVRADDVRGSIQASTTNGRINVRLHDPEPNRPVRLETTNGGIDLTMNAISGNDIRATTNNGGITLRLPSRASARVHARTSNSSIQSDFDVTRDRSEKNRLEGVIGSGGPMLDLATSNGSIRLLKL
jgi:hypothetical protein